jgi:hypothetical protein
VSKTLRVAVSWYQYEAGVSWSLFDDVSTPVNCTLARWLPSLRKFLSTIYGHFDLDDEYITPPQREHDVHLIDLVTRSEAFTEKEAAILNYCRIYLGVTTLSDISTAKGDMLIPGIEWGELDQICSSTTGHTTINKPQLSSFGHTGKGYFASSPTRKVNSMDNLAIGSNRADAYAGVGMYTMIQNTSFCIAYKMTRTNNTNYLTRALSTDATPHGNRTNTVFPF